MTTGQTVSPKIYVLVFGALLGLRLITLGVAFVDLGLLNMVVALAIATTKALLIALYFMHLRYSDRVTWVVAAGGGRGGRERCCLTHRIPLYILII